MSDAAPPTIPAYGRIRIPVSHGALEAVLKESADGSPRAAAVLCHPHPLHGGTMNNNVVYRAGKAMNDAGLAVLRFNFRGVGQSTGTHAHGVGEEDDAVAALDYLQTLYPGLPLWMAGFSFGARVGLTVGARDDRVSKLLGVGLALKMFDYTVLATCRKPKAIVQASEDEYGGRAEIEVAVAAMPPPKALFIVDGATHLYPKHLDEFERAAAAAVGFLQTQ
ncbi:MAG TPA: alpha/beta fold hydrolase [Polyangia bacterium]|jgi:alpha/beta superfamily hydrolase|nr:alpha/beta fold hydrolase [Polyangia bacterium]